MTFRGCRYVSFVGLSYVNVAMHAVACVRVCETLALRTIACVFTTKWQLFSECDFYCCTWPLFQSRSTGAIIGNCSEFQLFKCCLRKWYMRKEQRETSAFERHILMPSLKSFMKLCDISGTSNRHKFVFWCKKIAFLKCR